MIKYTWKYGTTAWYLAIVDLLFHGALR
jgi:hypothetical protein